MVSNEEIKRRLDAKRRGIQYNEPVGRRVVKKETNECPNCHTENPITAKFCVGCGTKLETPESEKSFTPPIKGAESGTGGTRTIAESEETPESVAEADWEKSKVTSRPDDFTGTSTQRISSKTSPPIPSKSDLTEPTIVESEKLEPIIPKSPEVESGKIEPVIPKSSESKREIIEPIEPQAPEPSIVKTTETKLSKEEAEKAHADVDPVERIKKAKELLDIGAITQEEFDMIKNKYLDEI